MKSSTSAFVGKWRIVEMDQWDQDYIDMEEEGQITFEKRGEGGLHFGCVDASLDWRYDDSLDRVDFTFVGSDEGTEVSGRGWAKMEDKGKQMIGQILFHQGEESGFTAKKGR
jgi:hypothetical protein